MDSAVAQSQIATNVNPATHSLPYAYGKPLFSGVLRQTPADFYVEEVLGFEPSGDGEHVFLWIQKTGINTQQVADRLARLVKIHARHISYAGMKDRHAVSRQWFSVHLPGKAAPDWQQLNGNDLIVLEATRHVKKLRRGVHRGNRFVITVSGLEASDTSAASSEITQRIDTIKRCGVPNYFGEQRFGHGGNNLLQARRWFDGEFAPKRYQRTIYLSAARSYLFNLLLARRVEQHSWNCISNGELLMLNGTNSVFMQDDQPNLDQRIAAGDIHITGPLAGRQGTLAPAATVAALEQEVLSTEPALLEGLKKQGLKSERRSLRLMPENLTYHLDHQRLEVDFMLPKGCFATTLLRECVEYSVSDHR